MSVGNPSGAASQSVLDDIRFVTMRVPSWLVSPGVTDRANLA